MKTLTLGVLTAAVLGLSSCAVHVHDDGRADRSESCSVQCHSGGHAKVSCKKPMIPACSCEPEVAAACISAERPRRIATL